MIIGQNAQTDSEISTHQADLHFRFFFLAGESQQVEERNAEEELPSEDCPAFLHRKREREQGMLRGEIAELTEPVEQSAGHPCCQHQDQPNACQAMMYLPHSAESQSGKSAADQRRQKQLRELLL